MFQTHFQSMIHLAEEIIKGKIVTDDQARVGVVLLGTVRLLMSCVALHSLRLGLRWCLQIDPGESVWCKTQAAAKNPRDAPGVYTVLELETVGIKSIAALEALRKAGGMDAIGRCARTEPMPLADGLWCCSSIFGGLSGGAATNGKRIWVLTNDDDPCQGNSAQRARVLQRVSDCRHTGEQVALWGLQRSGAAPFDPSNIWDAVVTQSSGEADDSPQDGTDADAEAVAAGAAANTGVSVSVTATPITDPSTVTNAATMAAAGTGVGGGTASANAGLQVFDDLEEADDDDDDEENDGAVVRKQSILVYDDDRGLDFAELESRKRAHGKRTFARLQLRFPGDVALGVCLYLTSVHAKVPCARKIDGRTNKPLKAFVTRVCAETGQPLRKHEIHLSLPLGSSGVGVPVQQADLAQVRAVPATRGLKSEPAASSASSAAAASSALAPAAVGNAADVSMSADPCVQVLSALPASSLRPWMLTGASLLAFPSEAQVAGSVGAFAAVHAELVASRRVLLGRMVAREGSAPRFVALVPQLQRPRTVLASAGLLVVDLPFADDLRAPQLPWGSPPASRASVELAKTVVSSITLNPFSPDQFDSPALGKFYATARCLALGEAAVEWSAELDDTVQPDPAMSRSEKYAAPLRRLQADCDVDLRPAPPEAQRPAKRPANEAESAAKRAKEAHAAAAAVASWRQLAQQGKLGKLTVSALRAVLSSLGLDAAGRKADLISRLEDHS